MNISAVLQEIVRAYGLGMAESQIQDCEIVSYTHAGFITIRYPNGEIFKITAECLL